ncbi:MAG TPA: antibiotic biosynthesis monooxygenase [Gemmatimonadaceae bacterium]|nr:antibiotic biosynthesis monooxygenase [Gemmatimonadaceae bacterium]
MALVVTVLESHVDPERAGDLQAAYAQAAKGAFPPGLIRSTLLRDANDPGHWRIETIWQSHAALSAMRAAGKPRGVQIFEAAGASPSLTVFDAIADLTPSPGYAQPGR